MPGSHSTRRTELGVEVIDVTLPTVALTCGDVREALVLAAVQQAWSDPVALMPTLSNRAVLNIARDICWRFGRPDFQHGEHEWPEVGEFDGDHALYVAARDRARRFWAALERGQKDASNG